VLLPKELAPGASASFDLRTFRDTRVTEWKGNALPRDATRGRFVWSVHSSGALARLVWRAEMVSDERGISSSYSCGQCCPPSFMWGTLSPYQLGLSVGFTGNYTVIGHYEDCNSSTFDLPIWSSWAVNYPSIASVYTPDYGDGRATGYSEGTTGVTASWHVEWWEPMIEDCILTEDTHEEPGSAEVVCAVPTNFRKTSGRAIDSVGWLEFNYAWNSTSGKLSDLANCTVGESLTYSPNPWPSPPFGANIPGAANPVRNVFKSGKDGFFSDNHNFGGTWVTPYTAATVTATQRYWYSCPC
jgi:hypothetical protein